MCAPVPGLGCGGIAAGQASAGIEASCSQQCRSFGVRHNARGLPRCLGFKIVSQIGRPQERRGASCGQSLVPMNLLPMLQPLNRMPSAWPGATPQPLRNGTRPGLALATPGQPQPASDGSQLGSGPGSRGDANFPQLAGASSSGRQLPNGVWWLDPASARHDVLYGGDGSFVLQRTRRGGPGLVPSPGERA